MSSSTMTKIAIILIEDRNFDLKSGVLVPVHDELVTQFLEKDIEEMSKVVTDAMERAGTFFSKTVKMTATPAIENYWVH